MTNQPEALRLADWLESELPLGWMVKERAAAAELRRLHALNQELLEALKDYGTHYGRCPQYPTYAEPENYPPCNCGYEAIIAKAEGEKL